MLRMIYFVSDDTDDGIDSAVGWWNDNIGLDKEGRRLFVESRKFSFRILPSDVISDSPIGG